MLHYVDDALPGITRQRSGRYWKYFDADGKRITDRDEIDRLNGIGMPPAYRDCWFSPDPDGHIQAIGYDAKGRRQYRYHPLFRAEQESRKYDRLEAFGRALPRLRKRVEEDMSTRATSCEAVIAAVVRLIDSTNMRVGGAEYARDNKSFGATTLRNRHAIVRGGTIRISYPGKHGIKRTVTVTDRRLATIARRTQDLPGQQLFGFIDDDGDVRPVSSGDVNQYIQEAMGDDFSAKDFRTWGASVIAFEQVAKRSGRSKRIRIQSVIEPVAEALGNTPAISRKSYVHPALLEAAKEEGSIAQPKLPRRTRYMSGAERGFLEFLEGLPDREPMPDPRRKAGRSGKRKPEPAEQGAAAAA